MKSRKTRNPRHKLGRVLCINTCTTLGTFQVTGNRSTQSELRYKVVVVWIPAKLSTIYSDLLLDAESKLPLPTPGVADADEECSIG